MKILKPYINEKIITYFGEINDVREIYSKCSVFVLPSYREGTPRTILEAMAMGRPIITTNSPGCRETVIHGKNGFLVKIKNVEDLIKAFEQFIYNPKLIVEMGEESFKYCKEKYEVQKVNSEMLKIMSI
jgi:glycosyltransferase involved in cell wall biosynthesis